MSEKICAGCHSPKPWEDFRRRKDGKGRLVDYCGVCRKIRGRYRNIRITYDLSIDQMEQMFVVQGGKCAICGEDFTKRLTMHVDHDHSSGVVRQLLCNRCNTGLGMFRESQVILQNAMKYLRKWKRVSCTDL